MGWSGLAIALGLVAAIAPARALPTGHMAEAGVLDALNAARAEPARYVAGLRQMRGFFHARILHMPGIRAAFATAEGVTPVNEAIDFLTVQPGRVPLRLSPLLARSAADHVADQSASGRIGHAGRDGSTPADRAVRRGGGRIVAEVIAYGAVDAADVVRRLIVDDGVADRGHRILLFSRHLRYAGVACGPHPRYRTMCVIDLADTPDGRVPDRMLFAQRESEPRLAWSAR